MPTALCLFLSFRNPKTKSIRGSWEREKPPACRPRAPSRKSSRGKAHKRASYVGGSRLFISVNGSLPLSLSRWPSRGDGDGVVGPQAHPIRVGYKEYRDGARRYFPSAAAPRRRDACTWAPTAPFTPRVYTLYYIYIIHIFEFGVPFGDVPVVYSDAFGSIVRIGAVFFVGADRQVLEADLVSFLMDIWWWSIEVLEKILFIIFLILFHFKSFLVCRFNEYSLQQGFLKFLAP